MQNTLLPQQFRLSVTRCDCDERNDSTANVSIDSWDHHPRFPLVPKSLTLNELEWRYTQQSHALFVTARPLVLYVQMKTYCVSTFLSGVCL